MRYIMTLYMQHGHIVSFPVWSWEIRREGYSYKGARWHALDGFELVTITGGVVCVTATPDGPLTEAEEEFVMLTGKEPLSNKVVDITKESGQNV